MTHCCIQLINPNTSRAMTARIHHTAQQVAAHGDPRPPSTASVWLRAPVRSPAHHRPSGIVAGGQKRVSPGKVRERCLYARQHDGIGAIVLGCADMADLAQDLTQQLGLPVIDGVGAAVKLIESLQGLGLTTSKYGDLDFPAQKELTGHFRGLN